MDVQINMPLPVEPVIESVTMTMSLDEAAYVCAILGKGNTYETYKRAGVAGCSYAYFQLHEALTQAGAITLVAKFAQAADVGGVAQRSPGL